jgi:hypothetical protein
MRLLAEMPPDFRPVATRSTGCRDVEGISFRSLRHGEVRALASPDDRWRLQVKCNTVRRAWLHGNVSVVS